MGHVIVGAFLLVIHSMSLYSIWNMLYLNIRIIVVNSCICPNLFELPRPCDRRNKGVYVTMLNDVGSTAKWLRRHTDSQIRLQWLPLSRNICELGEYSTPILAGLHRNTSLIFITRLPSKELISLSRVYS